MFSDHTQDLARLGCHIVFGTMWGTKHQLDAGARLATEYRTLNYPNLAKNSEAAQASVSAVLAARADLDKVFARPNEMVAKIAAHTRGNLRASLTLAKHACEMSPAQRLAALRERERLPQTQLAQRAGVDISTVVQAEHGFEVSEAALQCLAAALGLGLDDLIRPGPASLEISVK